MDPQEFRPQRKAYFMFAEKAGLDQDSAKNLELLFDEAHRIVPDMPPNAFVPVTVLGMAYWSIDQSLLEVDQEVEKQKNRNLTH
jgi:hypothetical protein